MIFPLLLMDVTLIIKLLKNGKLLKFCYLDEDSEDLKPYADVVKVLTEDSKDFDFSCVSSLHPSSIFHQKPMNFKIRLRGYVIK